MTVQELIDALLQQDPTDRVFIHLTGRIGWLGFQGSEITQVVKGFDWNRGKTILETKDQLTKDK